MDTAMDVSTTVALPADDHIRPFAVPALDLRGRVVRLGPLADAVISRHAYPEPIARLVGETLALTALLGSSLKFDGRFVLQAQSDGPISLLVADYANGGDLRAYCRFDADRVEADEVPFGSGHLAFTIDQGADMQAYQGIVPLEGQSLTEAGEAFFRQSEQIPTRIALAAGEVLSFGAPTSDWRSGGLFVQHLPEAGEAASFGDPEADAVAEQESDAWNEAGALIDTIEAHELLDPGLDADRLLYRLFHERGVRVFEAQPVNDQCRCSPERIEAMIAQFTEDEVRDMTVDGEIQVKCEFCGRDYRFDPNTL